jgi:N-acetylglutamate synthase-like GNAT family acetyltransferase
MHMALTWSSSLDKIDWPELEELYRLAPLRGKSAQTLQKTFGASRYRWFARDNETLVAAGRALADGAECAYLCDIAVRPSHQGAGLGRELVARLLRDAEQHKKVILYATPGTEGFYRRFGFLRLVTAMALFHEQQWAIERGHLSEA